MVVKDIGLRPLGVVMMTIDCRAHDEAYCQAKIHDEAGQAKIHGCYFFGGKSLQKLPSMFFSQIKDLIPLPKRNGLNGWSPLIHKSIYHEVDQVDDSTIVLPSISKIDGFQCLLFFERMGLDFFGWSFNFPSFDAPSHGGLVGKWMFPDFKLGWFSGSSCSFSGENQPTPPIRYPPPQKEGLMIRAY